jgi:hypothetical protein
MGRTALGGCVLVMLWASPARAQEPPDLIFADGFETCPAGTGECDGNPATICETPLDTTTDCGACGATCDLANASETCPAGVCTLGTCSAEFGNCDAEPANGCETSFNTVSDCGGCGLACTNEHGTTACSSGACQPSCEPLWDSCDGDARNGCERSLDTLSDCGGCGLACDLANAAEFCNSGMCTLGSCDVGFGSCDGVATNGCEQSLNTLNHCGQCGQTCDLPNASESCSSGTCTLVDCAAGFADCDGGDASGCEVQLSGHSNAAPGENLGTYDADSATGFVCPGQGCDFLLTRSGTQGRFLQIRANEGSTCCAYLSLRFELVVPAGANYDLYVAGAPVCDPFGCSSTKGTGQTELVTAWSNDDCGAADNSFTAVVEVRYVGGTACQPWQLRVYRRECRS